jgi:hypothetical protein
MECARYSRRTGGDINELEGTGMDIVEPLKRRRSGMGWRKKNHIYI